MKTRTKAWGVTITALLLVVGLLAGIKVAQILTLIENGKKFQPPPEAVSSAPVRTVRWEDTRDAIGTLVAVRGVTLSAEVPGRVREIGFDSGTPVKKGDVLVRMDISTEAAQLAAAEADAALARSTLERNEALRRTGSNTAAEYDAARARARSTQAVVDGLRATIAKKTVRAPFDGRISIRQIELGQFLSPGSPIASLQSVSPIHAEFWLPEQALAEVSQGQQARLRSDTFPGREWAGTVTTINPEIDAATRSVRIRATFDNPDGALRPGMFSRVEVRSAEWRDRNVIPATAVLFAPYGDSVFVLEDAPPPDAPAAEAGGGATAGSGKVARQRFVRLGERRGDFVAVTSGLEPGETVAGSGAFKLRNGAPVRVNDALAPTAELAPRPVDP
jgi:membrane fusion protein (multidrug efflux system)